MMTSNNALVPDPDKQDDLASMLLHLPAQDSTIFEERGASAGANKKLEASFTRAYQPQRNGTVFATCGNVPAVRTECDGSDTLLVNASEVKFLLISYLRRGAGLDCVFWSVGRHGEWQDRTRDRRSDMLVLSGLSLRARPLLTFLAQKAHRHWDRSNSVPSYSRSSQNSSYGPSDISILHPSQCRIQWSKKAHTEFIIRPVNTPAKDNAK